MIPSTVLDSLRSFEDILEEHLRDPAFRAEWERTAPARALALRLVAYRAEHGLSQTALARRLGISQPALARMELGEHLPTLATLTKVAAGLGVEVLIDIRPPGAASAWLRPELEADGAAERVPLPGGGMLLLALGQPVRPAAD